jgi:drug/metabolite transporter (DMT)-like permease
MALLLGLAAALLYGGADFTGGLLSRRNGSLTVNLFGAAPAVVVAWVAIVLMGGAWPSSSAIGWGLASGIGGGAGTLLLYRGLSRGQMSVVGPVSAVGAAVLPVTVGMVSGERPGVFTTLGILVALPAIALVASSGRAGAGKDGAAKTGAGRVGRVAFRAGFADGLGAGLAFGLMFVGLARAGDGAGLWPIACEQTSAFLLMVALAVRARQSVRLPPRAAAMAALVGVAGLFATLLYFYATHTGLLAIVAVLTSLYPGVTVLLARLLLREQFSPAQRAGLALCALAVAAIALP